uniref:Uncharacterized protein n=1 Tax=Myoviridae sp. ctrMq22 TaxID=2825181 RepID=A0A8S5NX28_9CAUD|nr:MAG TPA: hypothetical protein [Myoviridae sp. ctrMq22]
MCRLFVTMMPPRGNVTSKCFSDKTVINFNHYF